MIEAASRVALVAERELEALVGVSTPSGDVAGAEEAVALSAAFLPPEADVERLECSTPAHVPDLVGLLDGSGTRRLLLLGHLDTVVAHAAHRPLARDGDRLTGSGAVVDDGMGDGVRVTVIATGFERPDRTPLFTEDSTGRRAEPRRRDPKMDDRQRRSLEISDDDIDVPSFLRD